MTTPHASAGLLERLFKLSENKTSFRTEVLAGVTTFLTMCYIIIVNPLILSETGMDHGAVFVATCLAAAIGCLVMGLVANYPIALAPGMGLNAYFTYSVCLGMGVPWQTALAAVFVSGIVFLAISFFKIREAIVNAIPMSLKFAIGGGIGLFLALIALKNAGIIVDNPATLVGLGDIKQPAVLLALFGFLMIVVLHQFKVRGAIIMIDYGFDEAQYYHPQRSMGTLIGHYRHHVVDDPFFWPGLMDLTCHVNFTAMAQAAVDNDLDLIGYTSQAHFLFNLGITEVLLAEHPDVNSKEYLQAASAMQKLVAPHEMGELFKVIAMGKGVDVDWQGFANGDWCHKL